MVECLLDIHNSLPQDILVVVPGQDIINVPGADKYGSAEGSLAPLGNVEGEQALQLARASHTGCPHRYFW